MDQIVNDDLTLFCFIGLVIFTSIQSIRLHLLSDHLDFIERAFAYIEKEKYEEFLRNADITDKEKMV